MTEVVHGIKINRARDSLFDELGLTRLKDSYMADGEESPQERFAFVSSQFGSNPEHAQRLYEYSSKHWLSYSTPILSFGRNKKGLPVSCYLNCVADTASGLVDNLSETNWLSMMGGGVGVHLRIRGADNKSVGVMPHLKVYDAASLAYKQGTTRRGSFASYLDISHPDIIQFIEMRKPTGDQNMRTLNMNHGINITNEFMEIIERCMLDPNADDSWDLKQPHNGYVVDTVSAKDLWMRILEMRMQTGEPYLWFIDTANAGLPDYQKKLGLKNNGSNLCSEISLATDENRTAVCCLSSLNLEHYNDWKDDKLFVGDILEMLDNVLTYFIENAPDTIQRAKYSAMRERSVGIGALGFHAYLQKNNIAFEGVMAKSVNNKIFKSIRDQIDKKNIELANERGACPDAAEFGVNKRLSHTMAVAPNACQSKDNLIKTTVGNMSLGQFLIKAGVDINSIERKLEKQWVDLQNPIKVPTLDGEKEVSKVWYNGYEEVIEIEFEDGKTYKFTENHRLLVKTILGDTEWVRVGDLTGNEDIVSI
jgi:ribonucleoside-diphosphate reductase alpha chain